MSNRRHQRVAVLKTRVYFKHPNMRIRIIRELRQPPVPEHRHEFFEIVLVLSGTGIHVSGDSKQAVNGGDVFVLNNHRAHGFESTHNLHLINILVRNKTVSHLDSSLGKLPGYRTLFSRESLRWRRFPHRSQLHLSHDDLHQCEEWAEKMESEGWQDAHAGTSLAEAYLTLLAALLTRRFSPIESASQPGSGFKSVCALLGNEGEGYPSTPIPELAKISGMSQRTLQRVFQKTFGMTPSHYKIQARLHHAEALLCEKTDGLRISEIASKCGFNDSNYFSRFFRQATGQSPRTFRKVHLAAKSRTPQSRDRVRQNTR